MIYNMLFSYMMWGNIFQVQNNAENNKSKQASIFSLYMNAVSIVNNKNQSHMTTGTTGIEFNLMDYYAIRVRNIKVPLKLIFDRCLY